MFFNEPLQKKQEATALPPEKQWGIAFAEFLWNCISAGGTVTINADKNSRSLSYRGLLKDSELQEMPARTRQREVL